MRMIVAVAAGDADATERRGIPHLEFVRASSASTCAPGSCRHRDRRHQRCHRRGHGHGHRRHRRDDRRSRRRRGAAGAPPGRWKPPPAPPGRPGPPGRCWNGAPGRRAEAAGPRALARGRPDAARRDAEPPDAGCCRALPGAAHALASSRTGCCPDAGRRDAGPCPALTRTGCCPGAGRPGRGAAEPARRASRRTRRQRPALGSGVAAGCGGAAAAGAAAAAAAAAAPAAARQPVRRSGGRGARGAGAAGSGRRGAASPGGLRTRGRGRGGRAGAATPSASSAAVRRARDGRRDAGRRALDELAHVLELVQGRSCCRRRVRLAISCTRGLRHNSPVWGPHPDRSRR